MIGDKRRDLHRFGTAAMALVTVALVVLHFTGRESVVRESRNQVAQIHEQARNVLVEEVKEYRSTLARWNGEPEWAPFASVRREGETESKFMVPFGEGADRCLVQINARDTNPPQEGEAAIGGTEEQEYGFLLSHNRRRLGRIVVKATVDDPAAPAGTKVAVEVLLRRGNLPEEHLKKEEPPKPPGAKPDEVTPFEAVAGEGEAARTFVIDLKEKEFPLRHDILVRVGAGASQVKVSWKITFSESLSESGQREGARHLAIGITRTTPEREEAVDEVSVEPGKWVPGKVRVPAQQSFIVGYVPLDRITGALRDRLVLDRTVGERVYLTDPAGIVMEAIPDFPETLRTRLLAGKSSLISDATEHIKMNARADTGEYEGFTEGQRMIGAFGPVRAVNGGIIVERSESLVLAPYRGLKSWHVALGVFVILLLIPLVPPVVRRIREDTEIPRLLQHARRFVPHVVAIVGAAALAAVVQGVMGFQTKVVMDEVILSGEASAYDRLTGICWLLAGLSLVMFALNWVKEYLGKVIQNRMVMEIRCTLSEKIAHLPMMFHARQRTGDLLSRIQNDVAETSRGLEMLFGDIISDPIMILVLTGSCFVINWRLALVVFIGLPIILVPVSYFGRLIKKSARKRQAKKADVTHAISQMLSGIRVVKAFRMEDHEAKRIRAVSGSYLVEALKVARAQVTSKESLDLFNHLSSAVVLALGGYLVLERQVTVGDLGAFTFLIGRMFRSSKNLTTNYNKLQESLAGTERIFEIFDTPDTMADRPGARALVRPRTEIAFDRVSFRYADDAPWVLRDVSFRVPVGTSVAVVGATGAGKSTLLDLVARFYDPQEGRVLIDGMDVRGFSRDSLLSHVAVVTQEAFLFNESIAENLRYGRLGASQTEIESAARAAFVHEEILKQAEGYDTVVGERGSRLSGGQRQRVTIARAILKDPPILLLDEATSALDSRSEKMVQDALQNLMKDRTTFVIAHRLSTIQGVDRILVVEAGTIVEQGTHEELIRIPNGHYRHLYEIQFAAALNRGEAGPTEDDAVAG